MNNIFAPIDPLNYITISATQCAKPKMKQLYVKLLGLGGAHKIKPN